MIQLSYEIVGKRNEYNHRNLLRISAKEIRRNISIFPPRVLEYA